MVLDKHKANGAMHRALHEDHVARTWNVGESFYSLEAQGVAVAVIDKTNEPFGGVDGLLGMSFLARFKITLSQTGGEISAIPIQ